MKSYALGMFLGVILVAGMGASVFKRIGDLPISSSPSANTWIEIDDLSANPRSARYQLNKLALATSVSGKQDHTSNLDQWSAISTNVLSQFLLLTGGTLSGALTVNADVDVTGTVTVTGGGSPSTFQEITSTNGYNKDVYAGVSFTNDMLMADGTTNRIIVLRGIVVTNIANWF